MENFTILMGYAGPVGIAIIIIFVLAVTALVYFKTKGKRAPNVKKDKKLPGIIKTKANESREAMEGETETDEKGEKSILGTGNFKCLAFRLGNIADFTTIPKPIGEAYQFDPSCPFSGMGYIVKESNNREVVDYDPREVPFDVKKSPEYAWFATHWPIVKVVFSVAIDWWKSKAIWFAGGMMLIVFIVALAVVG